MRQPSNRWIKHLDFTILDIFIVELSYVLAIIWRLGVKAVHQSIYHRTMVFIFVMALFLDIMVPFLQDVLKRTIGKELQMTMAYGSLIAASLAVYQYLLKVGEQYSRAMFLIFWGLVMLLLFICHVIYKKIVNRFFIKREKLPKIFLVTEQKRLAGDVERLHKKERNSFDLSGICLVDDGAPVTELLRALRERGVQVTQGVEQIMPFVQGEVIDDVLIDVEDVSAMEKLVQSLLNMGLNVHIRVANTLGKLPNQAVGSLAGRIVVSSSVQSITGPQLIQKRLMDIAGSLVGLVITGILYLIFAPQIKKQSPGPVIYTQTRIGRNGRRFQLYKFRSMVPDADAQKQDLMDQNKMEGMMFKVDDDPRIFPVGRFMRRHSIDEFPQFWNVLKGEMSLVGTRPPTEDEWELYHPRHRARLSMKPGLTGLWQVSGRSKITNFEEVVALDVKYIREWSIRNDITIIFKTIKLIFTGKGSE